MNTFRSYDDEKVTSKRTAADVIAFTLTDDEVIILLLSIVLVIFVTEVRLRLHFGNSNKNWKFYDYTLLIALSGKVIVYFFGPSHITLCSFSLPLLIISLLYLRSLTTIRSEEINNL